MINRMSAKPSKCFLFLVLGISMLLSSFVGKAQNNSAVNLAGTGWNTGEYEIPTANDDNSVTTLTHYLIFYKQGRVKDIVVREKSIGRRRTSDYEYVYEYVTDPITGRQEYRPVYKKVPKTVTTMPSFTQQDYEGTYEVKGKSVFMNFPSFTISATVYSNLMKGVITHKDTGEKEERTFRPTIDPNNSSVDTNKPSGSSNLPVPNLAEKRQLAKTLTTKAENLLHQADDLRDKGKTLESQEKYCEAIKVLSAVIETELDTKQYIIEAYVTRASIKLRLEEYRGAIEDCTSAIQLSTPLKKDVKALMEALSGVESKAKSISGDVLEQATLRSVLSRELIEKNPEVSAAMDGLQDGYTLRVMAKSKLGDKAGACEDYRMLYSLGFSYRFGNPNEFCK